MPQAFETSLHRLRSKPSSFLFFALSMSCDVPFAFEPLVEESKPPLLSRVGACNWRGPQEAGRNVCEALLREMRPMETAAAAKQAREGWVAGFWASSSCGPRDGRSADRLRRQKRADDSGARASHSHGPLVLLIAPTPHELVSGLGWPNTASTILDGLKGKSKAMGYQDMNKEEMKSRVNPQLVGVDYGIGTFCP